eukprot:TRINITY_DN4275_c0_g1_i1.p1 TRINITY_DN4275_c0_g1~~TRINITY_DN4275_c0_g1_i1.p1  ORF type:complete len:135 (+),score=26.90 TRINITY_DN4275_c0_g1_i1:269-673(+)
MEKAELLTLEEHVQRLRGTHEEEVKTVFDVNTGLNRPIRKIRQNPNYNKAIKHEENDPIGDPELVGLPHREKLIAFYKKYKPEKLSKVDSTLAKFVGRENIMWELLSQKYAVELGHAKISKQKRKKYRLRGRSV